MLYSKNATDPYKTSVIDTMVAEIQSVPGEDRCVLLLGYKDQMEEMFQVTIIATVGSISLDLTRLHLERQPRTCSTICDRECIQL